MKIIKEQTFDEERALYASKGVEVIDCKFDGPADGESAFKESTDIAAKNCFFNLRYPFWHDKNLVISNCELTELCRAALWYTENAEITDCELHGIKALRECSDIKICDCDIISPEFGWSSKNVTMKNTDVVSEYFMLRSENLTFDNVRLKGKYSFQYLENGTFENCNFDTKDAFWHSKNVTVKDSVIKGEYLAWYSESLTLINCKIIGTQPFCYCKGLKLVACEMLETDLCFEKSDVDATVTTPVISIKNPLSGKICVPSVGEIIRDDPQSKGEILVNAACVQAS